MRTCSRLTDGWRFCAAPDPFGIPLHKSAYYAGAKTESHLRGFASLSYVETSENCRETWTPVTVPHDYIIRQMPSPDHPGTLGSQDYPEGWYRRNFRFTEDDRGRRIVLCFEAVATDCAVFFNGCPIVENHTAYTPFEADITDYVRFGEDEVNLLAVHIRRTEEHEGWWYTGAGIVRDVWLLKTDPTAVDHRGIWVRPVKIAEDLWRCEIETTLVREADTPDTVTVTQTLCGQTVSTDVTLTPYEKAVVRQTVQVQSPALWDTENPALYDCRTNLLRNGGSVDEVKTEFGFRTAEFLKDGFYLNGIKTLLRGVSNHEDYGITGRAVPLSIRDYRVRLMKEMGANAWRCAHYPHSDSTMATLDRCGMLTMAETRHFSAAPTHMRELETLIRRDRNHPSVILWSIGNEEWFFMEERGARIARRMIATVRRLDPDRAVTAAVDKNVAGSPVHDLVDVMGVNYNMRFIDALHERLPEKPMIFSECTASGTTRSWYGETDADAGTMAGYDRRTNAFGHSAAYTWKFIDERPFLFGGYQWTGIEYRGEAEWPRLGSVCGAVDLFLQKKDNFYRMRTIWTDEPEVHILPHWNFRGMEGQPIPVQVYTNCAAVQLTLNGTEIGTEPTDRYTAARFFVPYAPGVLCAVGLDAEGREIARHEVRTTGEAVRLQMVLDNAPEVEAHGADAVAHVSVYAVDADGNRVPDATDTLFFGITGAAEEDSETVGPRARILGTGSSNTDPVPPHSRTRVMYAGAAAVAVQTADSLFPTAVTVRGDRLGCAMLTL